MRASSREAGPRARVLIVDDNDDLVHSLHAVLTSAQLARVARGAPMEVTTASRGDESLAVARQRGFDVAIVDVKLPDASGVDLIPTLRQLCPFGEIILITGFATMDTAMEALRLGAYAFIPKSFRPEELASTVEQALAKVRLARERDELERRYRALVDLTDVLVVGLDVEGQVALFNRKASIVAAVEPTAAVGRAFVESWIAEEDQARVRGAVALARAGKTEVVEAGFDPAADAASARGDLPRRVVRWHFSMAQGDQTIVYGFGIDVTEGRALEKRAADAEALSAMARLALNLAHEIRNPLNAALLQLHLLGRHIDKLSVDEESKAGLRHRAQIVGDEIGRLSRLLTEFLDLARPRAVAREKVHLDRLVAEVLDLEQSSAADRGITVERDLAPGCDVIGDAEKLKQAILNVVVNAMDAVDKDGLIRVRLVAEGALAHLSIEDDGVGIEASALSQVFDPFYTTKEAGTGLGLSIVRKIMDQHGGQVRIEGGRPRGTRVSLLLPRER